MGVEKKFLTNSTKYAINSIENFLKIAEKEKTWGVISIRVKNGEPTLIEFHQTYKLPVCQSQKKEG